MALKDTIQADLTAALKSRDDLKLQTLRLLSSAIHNEEIAQGKELSESDVFVIVKREMKQRKEAIESYRSAGRDETADKEEAEMKLLEVYLPAQMSEAEVIALVEEVLASSPDGNAGQIIGVVMKKAGGNADGNLVAKIVNQKLS
ncbi:GatB/YqeY domain-containing protein [Patescibacteria group bacterium]|nr:GatB/YqeY domain-containing protein [Patescibacteria group bacterium]MBU1082839.1 GatB/YqeY domain-containing protein [Patescibacteria group bacterium]